MRGEVNEAIFAERGVERRKAAQFWRGARIDRRRTVPSSYAHSRRRRTPARRPADTVIGGREDRVGKDYDAALSRLPHSSLPNYRRQRRGRRNHDHLMISDQWSVGFWIADCGLRIADLFCLLVSLSHRL